MSAALVHPVWLPPRTTLGAPNTMKSPASAASRAVSSLTGNSAMPTPCARNAFRIVGLSSSCDNIRTPASRAAFASRAIEAGTSCPRETTRSTRESNASPERPVSFDHAVSLLRLGKAGDGGIHMVVECEQVDSSVREPLSDLGFSIEIVGLVAQMEAGIRRQLRPQLPRSLRATAGHYPRCAGQAPTTMSWRERPS